jgi:hypothetical protein
LQSCADAVSGSETTAVNQVQTSTVRRTVM